MGMGQIISVFWVARKDLLEKLFLCGKCLRTKWTNSTIIEYFVWLLQTRGERPLSWVVLNGRTLVRWIHHFCFLKCFMTIDSVFFVIGPDGFVITLSQQTLKLQIGFIFQLCFSCQFLLWDPVAAAVWQEYVCEGKLCPVIVYLSYFCFIQLCCIGFVAHLPIPQEDSNVFTKRIFNLTKTETLLCQQRSV